MRDLHGVSDAVRSARRISRFDDLFSVGFDVGRGVAGIDDEPCVLDNPVVVVGGMVSGNQNAVIGLERCHREFPAGHA